MSEQTGTVESREEPQQTQGETRQDEQGRGEQNRHRGGRNRSGRGNRPRSGGGGQHQPSEASLNMTELHEIAALFSEHGLTDFEFENENIRVRFRKELTPQIVQQTAAPAPQMQAVPPAQQTQTAPQSNQIAETAATQKADEEASWKKITSQTPGTFYSAPSPDAEPFVKIGSAVNPKTVVCIIEAMKLMNEIEAEVSGEIVKIYVENGQPVEYGQPLFAVK